MDTDSNLSSSESGGWADSDQEPQYYDIARAATLLGVSRVTIWRWIRAGQFPASRLGHRTVRIKREDLEQFLTQGRVAGAASAATPRAAPRVDWSDLGAAEHIAQFYETDERLMDTVGVFIGAALRTGDAGIVIATEAHRAGIEDRLRAAGLDLDAARAGGRYTSPNAAETLARLMIDGEPEPRRFAEIIGGLLANAMVGGRRVRVFSDLVALLVGQGNDVAALRLEGLWNEMRQARAFALLCGYAMDSFGTAARAEQFSAVCAAHARVIPTESYTARADPDDRLRDIAALQQQAASLTAEIAERRQTEEQLLAALESERRSERALRDFVETAPLGLHWVGLDGTILWANQAQLELLGYSSEEFIGRHIAEFHADQEVIDDILVRLSRGETVRARPARLRRQDGSIKQVLIDSSPLWEEGQFIHSRCLTRDLTDLRHAEETRTRLLERERTALGMAQRAAERTQRLQEITIQLSHSLEANQTLATIARSAADLLQVPIGAVFLLDQDKPERDFALATAHGIDEARMPDLRLPRHASLAGRAIDEGRTLVADDVRETTGTALPALLTGQMAGSEIAAPITAGAAQLGVVKAFSPIVQRFSPDDAALLTTLAAAAAVALTNARLYHEAHDAIRARDEFLESVAHDLKTPITAIKATAQLLRRRVARIESATAARLVEGLALIDATTTTMAQQMDEMLDLARLQVGQQLELRRRPIDLVALARQIADEQQRVTRRHRLRVDAEPDIVIGVWDAARLTRVLDNLLSNAIKYSPAGGDIVVTIRRQDDAENNWAVLTVRDAGLGIPAVDLPHIFERFQRAGNVTGRIVGTGIGLSSARQIVEQHNGAIAAESVEGAGSVFTVRLPLEPGDAEETETAPTYGAPPDTHGPATDPRRDGGQGGDSDEAARRRVPAAGH